MLQSNSVKQSGSSKCVLAAYLGLSLTVREKQKTTSKTSPVRHPEPKHGSRTPSKAPDILAEVTRKIDEMKISVIERAEGISEDEDRRHNFTIWDFGGQNVYYTSHQTFLSSRAIYLLVMDITKPLDTVLDTSDSPRMWKDTGAPRTVIGEDLCHQLY